jgi:hypothetical protein
MKLIASFFLLHDHLYYKLISKEFKKRYKP